MTEGKRTSYDAFLSQFQEEDEDDTFDHIANIRCTPMSNVSLRRMRGEEVGREEITKEIREVEKLKAELLGIFDEKMRTYVGGIKTEKGIWEFGLCDGEEEVAKLSDQAGDYTAISKRWCLDRNVSWAFMEPSPSQKLERFFDMLVDMGLDDVEELREEDYSCRVITKAIEKLGLQRTVPSSLWDEQISNIFTSAGEKAEFKKLLNLPT